MMVNALSGVTSEKLSLLVHALGGSAARPSDEDTKPLGPWGPVIRAALKSVIPFGPSPEPWDARISSAAQMALIAVLSRHPEIWELIGGGRGGLVSLNPQPLPPRVALMSAVADAVMTRAEFMLDIAQAMQSDAEKRGIIIVSGYVNRFAEEWCHPTFKPKFPVPEPHPNWLDDRIDGADLIVIGTALNQGELRSEPSLREAFSAGARIFLESGFARLK